MKTLVTACIAALACGAAYAKNPAILGFVFPRAPTTIGSARFRRMGTQLAEACAPEPSDKGHSEQVSSVAFSPDGGARVLSGSWDHNDQAWDAATGALIRTFDGHSRHVSSVSFSPGGAHVLSGSSDATMKLWDTATGALIRTFEGHSTCVSSEAFSPDRVRVLSGSWDGTIRIWDLPTGQWLVSLLAEREGEWLAMTPAGFFVASDGGLNMLSVVRGFKVFSVDQFRDQLQRKDLLRELLSGDVLRKYEDAASKLNLEKILDSGPTPTLELLENEIERKASTSRTSKKRSRCSKCWRNLLAG